MMNETSEASAYIGTPLGNLTVPGAARAARAALSPAARRKLERLELAAEAALLRAASDRVRDATDERQRLERQLEMVLALHPTQRAGSWVPDPDAGPRAKTWVPSTDGDPAQLERQLAEATDDVQRYVAARDLVQEKWTNLRRLVDACRAHLNVPAI